MRAVSTLIIKPATRMVRRLLVGPNQRWIFTPPPKGWRPPSLTCTSLYLHVPFCRHFCPYCPYTKVPYDPALVEPYRLAAIAEIDWWAGSLGRIEVDSIYIGGGTPTLAWPAVTAILRHIRERFRLTGELCVETNPADVTADLVHELRTAGVSQVSLGVESFLPRHLHTLGRRYGPETARKALELLGQGGFKAINVDLMFALPHQTLDDVLADLECAHRLGADQITTYPLFTFPYTSVGTYLRLAEVKMPGLLKRWTQLRAISRWCARHGYERVSVWSFRRGQDKPRYSSVTRHGYIGVGPGAGSHLPGEFVLNTFDLQSWQESLSAGSSAIALRLPFVDSMSGWWWLYWRIYDTRIPLSHLETMLGPDAPKARRLLNWLTAARLAREAGSWLELTEAGAFWLHLAQNYFALDYVNTIWTAARRLPWPEEVAI